MANTLSKTGITTGATVQTWHITQSIDAFTEQEAYDIYISGSLYVNNPLLAVTDSTVGISSGFLYNSVSESIAIGRSTEAIGSYSFSAGEGTIASGSKQTVVGTYNTQGDNKALFIVGNGTSNGARKDAFKITTSGSITLPNTQSTSPSWSGSNGEIVPATVGGQYLLYMWMNGAWRSGSFV